MIGVPFRREAEFQSAVIRLAELLGWRVMHHARSRGNLRAHSSVGFPDLFMVRGGRQIAAELKTRSRTTTPEQRLWLAALADTGAHAAVWVPDPVDLTPAEQWPVVEVWIDDIRRALDAR